jgi:hypothetical protein
MAELTVWNNHDAYKVGNTHLCFTGEDNQSQYVEPINTIKIYTSLKNNIKQEAHYINGKGVSSKTYKQIMEILLNKE